MLRYKLLALYEDIIVNILIISMFQRLIPTGNTRVFAVMALWGWASAVAGISFLWNEAPRSKLRGILQPNINSSAASREVFDPTRNKHFNLVLSGIGLIVSEGIVGHI